MFITILKSAQLWPFTKACEENNVATLKSRLSSMGSHDCTGISACPFSTELRLIRRLNIDGFQHVYGKSMQKLKIDQYT